MRVSITRCVVEGLAAGFAVLMIVSLALGIGTRFGNRYLSTSQVLGLVVVAALLSGVLAGVRRHRILVRTPRPHGHCPTCGYDPTGNTSGVCTECGGTITMDSAASNGHR